MIPINLRIMLFISLCFIGFVAYIAYEDNKAKQDYQSIEGRILYLDERLGNLPYKDLGKYRYLQVEGYPYTFELFVSQEEGDFKPKYEQVDNLKINDIIRVYFIQRDYVQQEGINRNVQFIDKGNISFFERSESKFTVIGLLIISILFGVFGIGLWKFKKIPF